MKQQKKTKVRTIHTSRTIMFDELNALISHGTFAEDEIVALNVFNKQSGSGIRNTLNYLSRLYDFKKDTSLWKAFHFLWEDAEEADRRLMSLLYAINKDDLLRQSIPVIQETPIGRKVKIDMLLKNLLDQHDGQYSPKTLLSTAQNMASSWKKAGYIEGKVRNIRVPVNPGYLPVLFALYLGERDGNVGQDLLNTIWMSVLELSEERQKELLSAAARHDFIEYQEAGGVTIIRLQKLHNRIAS